MTVTKLGAMPRTFRGKLGRHNGLLHVALLTMVDGIIKNRRLRFNNVTRSQF